MYAHIYAKLLNAGLDVCFFCLINEHTISSNSRTERNPDKQTASSAKEKSSRTIHEMVVSETGFQKFPVKIEIWVSRGIILYKS